MGFMPIPASWLTDVTFYFQRIERGVQFGVIVLVMAFFTLGNSIFPLAFKTLFFLIFSGSLFCMYPVLNWYAKKKPLPMNEFDQESFRLIKENAYDFSQAEQKVLLDSYAPTPPILQGSAIIILCWCMLFELFVLTDLAKILSHYTWVKDLVDWVGIANEKSKVLINTFFSTQPQLDPTSLALSEHPKAFKVAQKLYFLEIFKVNVIAFLPLKIISVFIIVYRFLGNPDLLPFTATHIFSDENSSKFSKFKSVLLNLFGIMIFMAIGTYGLVIMLFFSMFQDLEYLQLSSRGFWFQLHVFCIVGSFSLTIAIKLIADWLSFIFFTQKGN